MKQEVKPKIIYENPPKDGPEKIAIINDIHFPFHNEYHLNRALDEIKEFDPDIIVLNGDVIDSPHLGKYLAHPNLKEHTDTQIALAWSLLSDLRKVHPNARIIYIEGNHDWRVKGYLIRNAPELYDEMWLPERLKLSDLNIEWVPTKSTVTKWTDAYIKIEDVYIGHFDKAVAKAGRTVQGIAMKKGNFNFVQAHIHRAAINFFTDMEGNRTFGMEVPCLCQPPHYGNNNDEQVGWGYLVKEYGVWRPYLKVF